MISKDGNNDILKLIITIFYIVACHTFLPMMAELNTFQLYSLSGIMPLYDLHCFLVCLL